MVWPRAQSAACSLCPCPVILFWKLPSRIPLPTPGPPGTAPLTIPGKPQVKFRSPSLAPASQTAPTASPPPHGPEGNLVAPGDSPLTIHPPFPLPPPLHSQATTASEPPSHQPVNPCSPKLQQDKSRDAASGMEQPPGVAQRWRCWVMGHHLRVRQAPLRQRSIVWPQDTRSDPGSFRAGSLVLSVDTIRFDPLNKH